MAYPENMNLNKVVLSASTPHLTSGQNCAVRAPFRSRLMETAITLGSAAATADATVAVAYVAAGSTTSVSVLGSSVFTVTQANSYAGQVFTSVPAAEIILEKDSAVTFAVTGSSTSGGNVMYSATFKEA